VTVLRTGLVIFVVALVPRLLLIPFAAAEPVWDGHYFDFGARRIAEGFGYSDDVMIGGVPTWHPWCHYPVGYSAFLGFFYSVFGLGVWVPKSEALAVADSCRPSLTRRAPRHHHPRPTSGST